MATIARKPFSAALSLSHNRLKGTHRLPIPLTVFEGFKDVLQSPNRSLPRLNHILHALLDAPDLDVHTVREVLLQVLGCVPQNG